MRFPDMFKRLFQKKDIPNIILLVTVEEDLKKLGFHNYVSLYEFRKAITPEDFNQFAKDYVDKYNVASSTSKIYAYKIPISKVPDPEYILENAKIESISLKYIEKKGIAPLFEKTAQDIRKLDFENAILKLNEQSKSIIKEPSPSENKPAIANKKVNEPALSI